MQYDELRDYYDGLFWGSHINLFSVLHFYACGEQMGGTQLRQKLFFKSSPMTQGPEPSCTTTRTCAELRLRTILYHVIKAKEMGYIAHVEGTKSTSTRYVMTDAGRDFVDQQIQLRLDYLKKHPKHSIEQACNHIESQRLSKTKHFTKLAIARRAAPEDLSAINPSAYHLQQAWGINHVRFDTATPVRRHTLITEADLLSEDHECEELETME